MAFPIRTASRGGLALLPAILAIVALLAVSVPANATVLYSPVFTFKGTETPPGSFAEQIGLALDNDPTSVSTGDLYATDGSGASHTVVDKFTFPTSTTSKFSCVLNGTYVGLATTPCSANTTAFRATTTSGSTTLSAISSFSGTVSLNAVISGTGIPAGATVVSINSGANTLVLSAAATASGTGVSLTASPGFIKPTGVAVNTSGDVWAATEKAAPVIDEFSPAGVFMGAITESLLAGQSPATFVALRGVAVGPNNEVYVADATNNVVDKFVETGGVYRFECHLNATGTNTKLCGTAFTATTTNGSSTLTEVSSFTGGVAVGSKISGTGIPAGTTVSSVNAGTKELVMSANATASGTAVALTAAPTTTAFATLTHNNDLAVDSNGNVYAISAGAVDKFNAAGGFVGTVGSGTASAVAVNPTTNNLYVGYGTTIKEYCEEASCAIVGSLLYEFGSGTLGASGTTGLAVNAASSHTKVYAGDQTNKSVDVFELKTEPTTVTEACGTRQATELELKGTVNPEGLPATSLFEYGETTSYLSTVASSPSSDGSGNSPVAVTAKITGLIPRTVYHYRLHASNSELPANGLDATCETLIAAPAVNDAPVSAVSIPTSASAPAATFLSGTLNPEHDPTSYHFIYGTASVSEHSTPVVYGGSAFGDEEAAQTVEGLQPDTTCRFALVAKNEAGLESVGNEGTFLTQPESIAPVVNTGAAEGVTGEAATVTGTIVAQGLPTGYRVEFGTTTAYGTQLFGEAGSGRVATPIAVALNALLPGTTYHYRLVAINTGGTTYGADETFTTPVGPSFVLTQPPTPVLVATPMFPEVKEAAARKAASKPKSLTRAQKLAKALRACKQQAKGKRAGCEKQARKKYGPATKKKKR